MSWSFHDWRVAALVSGAAIGLAPTIAAAEVTPQIAVGGRVVAASNPFLLQDGVSAGLIEGTIEPSLTVGSSGGSELAINGALIGRQYTRSYGGFVLGSATARGVLRQSEKLSLTGLASYNRDLAADTLTDSIGSAADPRSVRNAMRGLVEATWRPSAFDTLTPQIEYERVAFEDSPLLDPVATLSGNLAYSRRLDERTTLGMRGTLRDSRTGNTDSIITLAAFVTGDRQLSPVWRLSGAIGAERLEQRGALPPEVQRVRTNFSGSGRLCADGIRLTGCLNMAIASEASPLGGLQRRYTIGTTAGYDLREAIRLTAVFDYSKAQGGQQGIAPALGGASAKLQLDWRASRHALVTAEIEYRRREVGAGLSIDGVFAGFGLRWGPR